MQNTPEASWACFAAIEVCFEKKAPNSARAPYPEEIYKEVRNVTGIATALLCAFAIIIIHQKSRQCQSFGQEIFSGMVYSLKQKSLSAYTTVLSPTPEALKYSSQASSLVRTMDFSNMIASVSQPEAITLFPL